MDMNSGQVEQGILNRLACSDADVVREAAFEAGAERLTEAVDLLVQHIQSDHLGVQEAAEYALRQIRGANVVAKAAPLLRSDNASVRNSAMDILREVGSDDMRTMNALLHDEDPDIRIFAADILGTSRLRLAVPLLSETLLHDPEVNVRYQAGISLGALGFSEAAEALRQALQDEEWVQFAAVEALAKIRDESCVGILFSALENASDLVASTIISALGEMGNVKAVPILLKRLDVVSGPLRNKTVKAVVQILGAPSLGYLSPKEQEKFREYLLIALEEGDEDILDAVLTGLSVLGGEEGTEAILRLVGRLDPVREQDLVQSALRSLVGIGFNKALVRGLRADNEAQVAICVDACGSIKDRNCVEALKDLVWEKDRDTQRSILGHLAEMCDGSDEPFFEDLLQRHSDPHVIKDSLRFLGAHAKSSEAGEKMLSFLDHPYDDVKEVALDACLALNNPVVNARMVELFRSQDPVKRLMATYAMGKISVVDHLSELSEALEDELPDIRKVALEAVGEAIVEHPEFLPMVIPRMYDENREVRLALVGLLGQVEGDEATQYLTRTLCDDDAWVRIRAIESLGARRTAEVVPQLVQMLDDSELLVMLKIIEALGNIGGTVAFRSLLALTSHESPDVQEAVSDAIARIRQEQGEGC